MHVSNILVCTTCLCGKTSQTNFSNKECWNNFLQYVVYPIIFHIYVKFSFPTLSWRENTGISYWASFSVLRYGIQLLLQCSVFSIHLMMLEYLLCVLNMQFCSSAGLYWHNFLRLVMIVQDLNRRMNSQLDYLIWLPF